MRKFKERNVRKITRSGSSLNITLPVEFIAKLGWKEKQKVKLLLKGRSIIIRDWKG